MGRLVVMSSHDIKDKYKDAKYTFEFGTTIIIVKTGNSFVRLLVFG